MNAKNEAFLHLVQQKNCSKSLQRKKINNTNCKFLDFIAVFVDKDP